MFNVLDDGTMKLTRGDTARFCMGTIMNNATDPPSVFQISENDILEFSVKKTVKDEEPLIRKSISGDEAFHILPTDTKALPFGRYIYDIQLTTEYGDVYTLTGEEPPPFILLKEVTRNTRDHQLSCCQWRTKT